MRQVAVEVRPRASRQAGRCGGQQLGKKASLGTVSSSVVVPTLLPTHLASRGRWSPQHWPLALSGMRSGTEAYCGVRSV